MKKRKKGKRRRARNVVGEQGLKKVENVSEDVRRNERGKKHKGGNRIK